MSKPVLEEILATPDVLLADNFEMYFTRMPVGTTREMRLQCMNVNAPGRTLEAALVGLFGYEIKYAGRNTTSHTMSATFVETRTFSITRNMDDWTDYARSRHTQGGNRKQDYAGDCRITFLAEDARTPAAIMLVRNVYPETQPEIQLDGSSTQFLQMATTWHFDEWVWEYKGGA